MTTTITKLLCPECRHENESERIYCHNCGARLDRSTAQVQKEPVDDTRRRVQQMFDPQGAKLRAFFFKIGKLILGAGWAAVVILILLPPDVPPLSKTPIIASQMRFDLENMSVHHQPAQIQCSDEQANAYLASALRTKQAALDKPLLDFKRALVAFGENRCVVTIERSLLGYSVYTACIYTPRLTDGNIVASTQGGSIGRLPIHPRIAQFMWILSADVWSSLDRDIKVVAKLGGMEFHDKSVVLTAPHS